MYEMLVLQNTIGSQILRLSIHFKSHGKQNILQRSWQLVNVLTKSGLQPEAAFTGCKSTDMVPEKIPRIFVDVIKNFGVCDSYLKATTITTNFKLKKLWK